ncbi:hypothetical protein CLV29_0054 [Naumannella halotolerans]|uniref:Uncharacterized protein n=1 Tax=Naumannella halotolerans TaxID=993414 RepID=A0A4R7J7L2_9ACTN|nr:hypothetical protein CLV29_0054 [Naumannella halotolerans]
MLPLVTSTIVPPGCRAPDSSAWRMIDQAARSFTLPSGLRYSSFASSRALRPRLVEYFCSSSSGVWPIRSVMLVAMVVMVRDPVLMRTTQCLVT